MTKEEYKEALDKIKEEYDDMKLADLQIRYARSNQRFHIGDIIESYPGTNMIILEESVGISKDEKYLPIMYYEGRKLKKNGELHKNAICYGMDDCKLVKKADYNHRWNGYFFED
jgi:hypothetical protein